MKPPDWNAQLQNMANPYIDPSGVFGGLGLSDMFGEQNWRPYGVGLLDAQAQANADMQSQMLAQQQANDLRERQARANNRPYEYGPFRPPLVLSPCVAMIPSNERSFWPFDREQQDRYELIENKIGSGVLYAGLGGLAYGLLPVAWWIMRMWGWSMH